MSNSMLQFQLINTMNHVSEGRKEHRVALGQVWMGSITLLLAFAMFALALSVQETNTVVACCGFGSIALGFMGFILLVMGWINRNNANSAVTDAENELKDVQTLIARENNR